VKLGTVTYDDARQQVTLHLARPFKGVVQVSVNAGLGSATGTASSTRFTTLVH
jgi:hypothetical protein